MVFVRQSMTKFDHLKSWRGEIVLRTLVEASKLVLNSRQ